MSEKSIFVYCDLCGKKIMERKSNGLFRFIFGGIIERGEDPPISMIIHGSIKMRCLRRRCRKEHPEHWNILTLLPNDSMKRI